MKVFFLIVVALYILYLIFLVVRACSELKNMPYSGDRLAPCFLRIVFVCPKTIFLSCVFSMTRSSTEVFDSVDICGPRHKVCFKENAKPEAGLSAPLN